MAIKKFTDAELQAIDRKFEHPKETVLCPRCGAELEYIEAITGCAVELRCKTEDCLRDSIRGF